MHPLSWQEVFRRGLAPLLSTEALQACATALETDDPRLLQGATSTPPPLACVSDWPVEAACFVGFAGWQGEGLTTVGEVEEYFARMCFGIDQRIGEPAGCRWFLNPFDDLPRGEIFPALLAEVRAELARREEEVNIPF